MIRTKKKGTKGLCVSSVGKMGNAVLRKKSVQTKQKIALSLRKVSVLVLLLYWISAIGLNAQDYNERFRPQLHFSPESNWMNDPNGLVYHQGEYHLFYQYNPFGDTWGHMSWGHAVSEDLVHWEHLPVALREENNIMIFSGSAVVDRDNTTGFGSRDNTPMIAIYTGHHTDHKRQDQRIAYSLDKGRTWKKFRGNPVLDEELENFRDPKVFWHDESQKWVMVVALPTEYKVRFYGSPDLKNWNLLSEFGPSGATGGIWECPDLFRLPVEGSNDAGRWVLQVDLNPGGPYGGSAAQYFIGTFDGKNFTQDPQTTGETRWVDHGKDFYALQSYANIPAEDGRRIWLAWMNNWEYAESIPTAPWRSAMTIPREVGLRKFDDGIFLVQQPVRELKNLRIEHYQIEDRSFRDTWALSDEAGINVRTVEIIARFKAPTTGTIGFKIAKGEGEETIAGYDAERNRIYIDRTRSGNTGFHKNFAGVHGAPLEPEEGIVEFHLVLDRSSIELFGNGGRVSITDRIFPSDNSTGITVFANSTEVQLLSLDLWRLESIWDK